jgi:hypothetical protein
MTYGYGLDDVYCRSGVGSRQRVCNIGQRPKSYERTKKCRLNTCRAPQRPIPSHRTGPSGAPFGPVLLNRKNTRSEETSRCTSHQRIEMFLNLLGSVDRHSEYRFGVIRLSAVTRGFLAIEQFRPKCGSVPNCTGWVLEAVQNTVRVTRPKLGRRDMSDCG